ncbi:hypothetical protein, partial [Wenyingzhuangia sp. 2_MG-2023]|uniref:hypothetical protein n=1 Tax=Wenyingzhuangia sp. 2_MG-2023 TaxID=3062639 RepID=UPI0026E477A7
MKKQIVKWLLTIEVLFCFYLTNDFTVNANTAPLEDSSQQVDVKDKPAGDLTDLRGGPENSERERQTPVDLR